MLDYLLLSALSACLLLLPAFHQPVHAGWFGEHKQIGDVAFTEFLAATTSRQFFIDTLGLTVYDNQRNLPIPFLNQRWVNLYQNQLALFVRDVGDVRYGLTYGDLAGLAGDHGVDPIQVYRGLVSPGFRSVFLLTEGTDYRGLEADMLVRLLIHHQALQAGLNGASNYEPNYILLSKDDESHFYRAGNSIDQHLDDLKTRLLQSARNYISRSSDAAMRDAFIDDLFGTNSIAKYAILHLIALDLMKQAGQDIDGIDDGSRERALHRMRAGFLFNAFADHYLQDAFASGHMLVNRSQWHAMDDNGIHDYYCRLGLRVSNARGDQWTAFGDNYYDQVTFDRATEANVISLCELWSSFTDARAFMRQNPDDVPLSLLDSLFSDPTLDARGSVRSSFGMFALIPTPFTRHQVDSIMVLGNSRNGTLLSIGAGASITSEQTDPTANLRAKIGFGVTQSRPSQFDAGSESESWAGISIAYAGSQGAERKWWDLMLGIDLFLGDRIGLVSAQGIRRSDGRWIPVWNPALGYEWKPISWSFAPSLWAAVAFANRWTPMYSLHAEFRYY